MKTRIEKFMQPKDVKSTTEGNNSGTQCNYDNNYYGDRVCTCPSKKPQTA